MTTAGPGQRYYHSKYKIPLIKWLLGPFHSMSLICTINMNTKQCCFHFTVDKTNILVIFGSLVYLIPKPKSFPTRNLSLQSILRIFTCKSWLRPRSIVATINPGDDNAWRVLGSQLSLFNIIFCPPYVSSAAKFLTDLTRTS